ncbi:MAG: BlaI/MecI/CopY family transcriptional regulator [Bacteroidales bacterium]|jgi:predicted transcriptional regulator|nr:BlaI/MecI/CopY family transcriptional regulator [Bacteroidales bacterium]
MKIKKSKIQELTKAEEQIMHILWQLEGGFVKEVVNQFPEPKPAYNTVSTFMRILVKKGIVRYDVVGNTHRYIPEISKEEYTKAYLSNFVGNYFNHSYKKLVSFFTNEEKLSVQELEEMKQYIEQLIQKQKEHE